MKIMLRLLKLFRPYAGWMALGIFLSLVTLLANVALMAISGWFIAAMALAGLAGVSMNYFTPAAFIRGLAITRTVGRYGERLVTHEATFRLLSELRVWFYGKLEPLAPAGLQDKQGGDLLSRISTDIDTLQNFYLRFLVPVVVALLALPVLAGFVALYSGKLALVLLVLLLLSGLVLPLFIQSAGRKAAEAQVLKASDLRAHLAEGQAGMTELLVSGQWEAHCAEAAMQSRDLIHDQKGLSALDGFSQGAIIMATNVAVFCGLMLVIPLVSAKTITPPNLPMLLLFCMAAFEGVMALPLAFRSLPQVKAAAERLFAIADAAVPVTDPVDPVPAPAKGDLAIKGLKFGYGTGIEVLDNLDLDLPQGKKLALLGATGSGKSSTINAILRFWERRAGSIQLDGVEIDQYCMHDLRAAISVMPQHVHLFNTTIRANLLLACPSASDEQLLHACRSAALDDFIASAPEGLDTFVGEAGMKVSGGQARRIGLARALLKDAPILVLDEPFEGLDPALARKVMQNVLADLNGRSLLLISHLPHGLESMDEILVLHRGQVTERGKHAGLIAQKGLYFQLQDRLGEHRQTG